MKKPGSRFLAFGLFMPLVLGAILAGAARMNHESRLQEDMAHFKALSHDEAQVVRSSLEETFAAIYRNLRTVARLPGVRSIDRHGENFDVNARLTAQEIYNNLASQVALSEVYIVSADFDPERIDPRTGKHEEPILMFDQLIVGRTGGDLQKPKEAEPAEVEEVEIFEYRLIREQLDWFARNFPSEKQVRGLGYPAIAGPEVVTCDNRRFDPRNPRDADRSGIVYSVPFYGPEGELRGLVAGIFLTAILREQLPSGDYALRVGAYDYSVYPEETGAASGSALWVNKVSPDPSLIYSEVLQLNLMDAGRGWFLWTGRSAGSFWESAEVNLQYQLTRTNYAGTFLVVLLSWAIVLVFERGRRVVEKRNAELEHTVSELLASRKKLAAAHQMARLGSWEWTPGSDLIQLSPELRRLIKREARETLDSWRQWEELVPGPDADLLLGALQGLFRRGQGFQLDHRLYLPGGVERIVQHQAEGQWSETGALVRILGTVQDVTERNLKDEKILLAGKVFECSSEAIVVTDQDGKILDANPAACEMTGYGKEEILGQNPRIFKSGRHKSDFYQDMWCALLDDGEWQGEVWDRRKNGEIYPKWVVINAVYNSDGVITHYVSIAADITQKKQTEEKLQHLAHFDPLTNLPNRLLLQDRLEQAIGRAERTQKSLALMFLDLDRFKVINDTLGHDVGDALLVKVAQRLRSHVRRADTVARLGGDEFTILLGELSSARAAAHVAQKIVESFAEPIHLANHELFVSLSIGISLYPGGGTDRDSLCRTADIAMYHAKKQGRNNYQFYAEEINEMTMERMAIEHDLRLALERDEFRLYYQPQMGVADRDLCGFEALVRWFHPQRGMVPPDRFISIAEETGLIDAIGDWVIIEACRQIRAWRDAGIPPLPVAVNLAARQFLAPGFSRRIREILQDTGIAPEMLELEITESTMLQDVNRTAEVLVELKKLGLKVAIDDFGTGYSSLGYLQKLPIDKLKIDKSFVMMKEVRPENFAIVSAVIAMAHGMGIEVLAEGVETEEILEVLDVKGCDKIQGYWYSRPLPADDVGAFVAEATIRGEAEAQAPFRDLRA